MQPEIKTAAVKAKRTKRRGNNEGSIYQRPDGRWVASVTVGYDGNGKRLRRVVYGWTKKEVQDQLTKLQSSKLSGTLAAPGRTTVAQYLDRWLETVAKATVRHSTFSNYARVVEKHINPRIGGVAIQKLAPEHVQGLYAAMARDKSGPNPQRLAHAVLHRALKQAMRWGLVVRNVCDVVEPPRVVRSNIRPLDAAQASRLLAAADGDRLEALYWVAIGGGLRLGELFGLQWSDVDASAGTVSVCRSLAEVDGKLELTEPKSSKGRRLVTLPRQAAAALDKHRKATLRAGLAGVAFVFSNLHGGPLRRSHFHAQEFKPLLKRAGLHDIRFHDLRHTNASLSLQLGESPKVVQERLGHSQISVTMDTYSHVMPGMQRDAAQRLDGLLIPQPSEIGNKLATQAG